VDIKALREFINDHPGDVVIRMVDGTEYRLPHRDYAWFTPSSGAPGSSGPRYATAFWLHDPQRDETRLVNAMLVKEVSPLSADGGSNGRRRRRRSRQ
jgi:hypothetical protein